MSKKNSTGKQKPEQQSLEMIEKQKVNYDILHTSIWNIFKFCLALDFVWCILFYKLCDRNILDVLNIIFRRPLLLFVIFLVFEFLYENTIVRVTDHVLMLILDLAVAIVVLLDFWTRGIIMICAVPIIAGTVLQNQNLIRLQAVVSAIIIWIHEWILYNMPVKDEMVGNHPALNFVDGAFGVLVIATVVMQTRKFTKMLDEQSSIDSLTHLYNHETFYETLDAKLQSQAEHPSPLCVLIADIDNFKKVNDTFGHAYGDKVLKVLADIFVSQSSERCFASRYGGEEFAMILDMEQSDALTKAQGIRKQFEHSVIVTEDGIENSFTVSVGVAQYSPEYKTSSQFFEKADAALYKAKKTGKNKVCI